MSSQTKCLVKSALWRPQTLLIAIEAILSYPLSPPPPLIIYPPGTYISVNNTEEKSMKTLSYFHEATQASKNPTIIIAAAPSVLLSSLRGRRGCGSRNRTRAQRLRVNHVLHVRSRGSCCGYINMVSMRVQGVWK